MVQTVTWEVKTTSPRPEKKHSQCKIRTPKMGVLEAEGNHFLKMPDENAH